VKAGGPGRPAQPTSRPSRPPFDLDTIQVIYSPEARCHASIHSPSAAEEQRKEGHHLRKERVELVDYSLAGVGTLQGRPRQSFRS
jgi:hypothetical protein